MLKSGIQTKTTSQLSAAKVLTTTTLVESGLEAFVSPNAWYLVEAVLLTASSGDGVKWAPYYSGVLASGNTTAFCVEAGAGSTIAIEDEITDATNNAVWHWKGLVRTSTSGRFYILAAKNTDVGADTSLLPGTYLTVRQV